MQAIATETSETVHLMVLVGNKAQFLHTVEGRIRCASVSVEVS